MIFHIHVDFWQGVVLWMDILVYVSLCFISHLLATHWKYDEKCSRRSEVDDTCLSRLEFVGVVNPWSIVIPRAPI